VPVEALIAIYVVLVCVASIVYTEEVTHWPGYGGRADALVLLLAVVFWPIPLLVLGWFALRKRYATWRHPIPVTPEESHDER
jgi:hypothetical protein